jgi:hypothetical protein
MGKRYYYVDFEHENISLGSNLGHLSNDQLVAMAREISRSEGYPRTGRVTQIYSADYSRRHQPDHGFHVRYTAPERGLGAWLRSMAPQHARTR